MSVVLFYIFMIAIVSLEGVHAAKSYGSEHSYTTLARIVRHAELHDSSTMDKDRLTEIISIPNEEYALDVAKLALATFYPKGSASRAVIDNLRGTKLSSTMENGGKKLAKLFALAHKGEEYWKPTRVCAGDAEGCFGNRNSELVMGVVTAYTGLYYAYAALEVSRDVFDDNAKGVDNGILLKMLQS